MLKVKAFERIGKVIKSIYIIISKFFLLKNAVYELIKLEDMILRGDNPFKTQVWAVFKKKSVYLKICHGIVAQKDRVYEILDNYYYRTLAVMEKSKISFGKEFKDHINDDPFQKSEAALVVMFKGILNNLKNYILMEKNPKVKREKIELAILIQLILNTAEMGILDDMPPDLEASVIFK